MEQDLFNCFIKRCNTTKNVLNEDIANDYNYVTLERAIKALIKEHKLSNDKLKIIEEIYNDKNSYLFDVKCNLITLFFNPKYQEAINKIDFKQNYNDVVSALIKIEMQGIDNEIGKVFYTPEYDTFSDFIVKIYFDTKKTNEVRKQEIRNILNEINKIILEKKYDRENIKISQKKIDETLKRLAEEEKKREEENRKRLEELNKKKLEKLNKNK